jgi:hypothetical protein
VAGCVVVSAGVVVVVVAGPRPDVTPPNIPQAIIARIKTPAIIRMPVFLFMAYSIIVQERTKSPPAGLVPIVPFAPRRSARQNIRAAFPFSLARTSGAGLLFCERFPEPQWR